MPESKEYLKLAEVANVKWLNQTEKLLKMTKKMEIWVVKAKGWGEREK